MFKTIVALLAPTYLMASPLKVHDFYASKSSLFKSGQAPESVLLDRRTSSQTQIWHHVQDHEKKEWVNGKSLLFPEDLKAQEKNSRSAYNLKDLFIRQKPLAEAPILSTIPQNSLLKLVSAKGQYAQVSFRDYEGYVSISDLILQIDFAHRFQDHQGNWHDFSYRDGAKIFNRKKQSFLLDNIKGYTLRQKVALLTEDALSPSTGALIFRKNQRLQILSSTRLHWIQSQLPGHGAIWWVKNEAESPFRQVNRLTHSEDFLKRDIYSIAFGPKNKKLGILSSSGIYISTDGEHWRQLEKFKDKNYPVAVGFNDEIYVGPYLSRDYGKTFDLYLKWDVLTQKIQSQIETPIRLLRMHKIEPLSEHRIRVTCDTGYKDVSVDTEIIF